jgi:hypothetical protein
MSMGIIFMFLQIFLLRFHLKVYFNLRCFISLHFIRHDNFLGYVRNSSGDLPGKITAADHVPYHLPCHPERFGHRSFSEGDQ